MSDTIQDLYDSFSEQMGPIQEDDRYFRYLFEMAQASDTTVEQRREELEKVLDEEWIKVIEDSLDAINAIIEKPRRFITSEEEVVPVSLAKRISADSVRHLSKNTQFLSPAPDGEVHPTHVLNVNTVETYDLYENRFVYHLIQRLLAFVDKRTDVIFWQTGNEICNRFKMHSKIDDAYEEIEYTVELSVKNRQSFAENDADNMDTFMRIDRVRRLVMSLASTSFCKLMAGCATVRSPIQRTNLMTKDPNYRTCYQLWQFMERYDEVGYTINVKDSEMAFDDEYLIQMYTNLINNYTVFKSLTGDERRLEEVEGVQREPVRPKFVKELKEELVADPDIPDVEVRRVFVEEVTQAQLDAEAALESERAASAQLAAQVEQLRAQVAALGEARDVALEDCSRAQAEAEAARVEADSRVAAAQAEADAQVAAACERADAQVAAVRKDAESRVADAQDKATQRVADAQAQAAAAVAKAEADAQAARTQAVADTEAAKAAAAEEVAGAKAAAEERVAAVNAAVAEKDSELAALRESSAAELAGAKDTAQRELAQARADAAEELSRALSEAEMQHDEQLQATQKDLEERISALIADLEQAERARERAEKRAEANSLSHYLLNKLRGGDGVADEVGGTDAGAVGTAGTDDGGERAGRNPAPRD